MTLFPPQSIAQRLAMLDRALTGMCGAYIDVLANDERYADRASLIISRRRMIDAIESIMYLIADARCEDDDLDDLVDEQRDRLIIGDTLDTPPAIEWPVRFRRTRYALPIPAVEPTRETRTRTTRKRRTA